MQMKGKLRCTRSELLKASSGEIGFSASPKRPAFSRCPPRPSTSPCSWAFFFDLFRFSCLKILETNFFSAEVALLADLIASPKKRLHRVVKRVRLCQRGRYPAPLCAEGNYLRGPALPRLC